LIFISNILLAISYPSTILLRSESLRNLPASIVSDIFGSLDGVMATTPTLRSSLRNSIRAPVERRGETLSTPITPSSKETSLSSSTAFFMGLPAPAGSKPPGMTCTMFRSISPKAEETPVTNPSPTESMTTIAATPMIMPRLDITVLNFSPLKLRNTNSRAS